MRFEDLSQFSYNLPPDLIAQKHAQPRDHSRLFVYHTDTDSIEHRYFYELDQLVPQDTAFVLNTTQVVPARLVAFKSTGGKVEVLFLLNESSEESLVCVANKAMKVGEVLQCEGREVFSVLEKNEGKYTIRWLLEESVASFLHKYGQTPLPPYIKHNTQDEEEKRADYQTVFAQLNDQYASVAAPTASLHFTETLLERLKKHHHFYSVQLHIGLGTFATLKPENFVTKALHREYISVVDGEYQGIHTAKDNNTKILAVGTTAMRTLESMGRLQYDESRKEWAGWTDLFVFPPYSFSFADYLITNFHVSESSLMLLVQAFLDHKKSQRKLVDLYTIAMQNGYKFYSLGDAMLIV